jgi:hypothetical protein
MRNAFKRKDTYQSTTVAYEDEIKTVTALTLSKL